LYLMKYKKVKSRMMMEKINANFDVLFFLFLIIISMRFTFYYLDEIQDKNTESAYLKKFWNM
ncbi:MAG: hypothetical protein Q8M94_04100, partial [Ignavibacteria bacterium]|nr:hypothetical protein [Ignavibacteria bacterium]